MNFLNKNGLRAVVQGISDKMNGKLDLKVSYVDSADQSKIIVDNTDPNNPIIDLSPELIQKIEEMWEKINGGDLPPVKEKEDTPIASIDFGEEIIIDLEPSTEYMISGILCITDEKAELGIDEDWFGTTIIVIKLATSEDMLDSDPQYLLIPIRPSAPLADKTDASYSEADGTITNVDDTMEYSVDGSDIWIPITSTTIEGLAPGKYLIRVRRTSSSFTGSIMEVVIDELPLIKVKENTPEAKINYIDEYLIDLEVNADYEINGTIFTTNNDGEIELDSDWLGTSLSIIKVASDEYMEDSDPQSITIPSRLYAPEVVKVDATGGNNNGELRSVVVNLEWSIKSSGIWTGFTGTAATNLAPGTYLVRVKASSTTFASLEVELTIENVTASAGWTITYTFVGPAVIPETWTDLNSWGGYDGTQIFDEGLWYITKDSELHTRMYAKYVTDADWVEVRFDGLYGQMANGIPNSLSYWGFYEGQVYFLGNNATSSPIQLKIVREG